MDMEKEFVKIDSAGDWPAVYTEIKNDSNNFSNKVAKNPENQSRNRYRDVNPFDHSRVKLQNSDNDYINASLVAVEEAKRNYILTQGPLSTTCGHFWLMVWEQGSKAIVMLNRVIEKDSVKCAQYWPMKKDKGMTFMDTGFHVTLLSEDTKSCYTVRALEVESMNTAEVRRIYHFHYTAWPDFGVPESPSAFLTFLFEVRASGSLCSEHGPVVVHCSAGIGRSGTFSLVDTCLVLMEKRKDPDSVNVKRVLLDMRKYRMGLIQTPDQLRFSYLAVIEGARFLKLDCSAQKQWKDLSKEGQPSPEYTAKSQTSRRLTETFNGNRLPCLEEQETKLERRSSTGIHSKMQDTVDSKDSSSLRKRHREDRKANTAQKVQQMKQKLSDAERKRKRPRLTDT